MNKTYTANEISILLGLDDIAHNRLYTIDDDDVPVPVSNWGTRNRKRKCYCELLRKLGIGKQ